MSSMGDAKSPLGDAKSSLGDAKSSLGDTLRARWVTLRARWVTLRARWVGTYRRRRRRRGACLCQTPPSHCGVRLSVCARREPQLASCWRRYRHRSTLACTMAARDTATLAPLKAHAMPAARSAMRHMMRAAHCGKHVPHTGAPLRACSGSSALVVDSCCPNLLPTRRCGCRWRRERCIGYTVQCRATWGRP
jgi:hypothetical protein